MHKSKLCPLLISVMVASCGNVQPTSSKPIDDQGVGGSDTDDFNIVGGTNAISQPFFASLRSDNVPGGQWCGGTFIADRVVLTAAHCLDGMLVKNLHVAVGETRNLANQTTTRRAKIERVIIHPDYDPYSLKNDIALLIINQSERAKLKSVVVMPLNNDAGLPERLGSTLKISGVQGPHISTYGFGNTTSYGFLPATTLQQAKLRSIPAATCRSAEGLSGISSSQICAGLFIAGGVDTCQGDSGGPLILTQGVMRSLVGITSFGQGCALPRNPGVYTRVSHFKTWIDQMMVATERVDVNIPRDPNRYGEVKDVISQRCFTEDNRTNSMVFNEHSQAFISIAPRYKKSSVILATDSSMTTLSSSCASQFEIPSNFANLSTKIDLRVGPVAQANDGTYTARASVSGQEFKLEKMPADITLEVACREMQLAARSIRFIAEGEYGLLALGEDYYEGKILAGSNAVRSTGNLISSCRVPANDLFGLTSATLEIRSAQTAASPNSRASVYASLLMIDSSGRVLRFGLQGDQLIDESGFDSTSAFVQMSATLRPNRQTYLLKLQNLGNGPVVNWEIQCNAAFSARLRAQVGALSPLRDSTIISNEIISLSGSEERAGWQSLGFTPSVTNSAIPGLNGRINPGTTVEMLVNVKNPAAVSTFACSLNNDEAMVLGNPMPVLSRDLIAQRFFSRKPHKLSIGRNKLLGILRAKD